MLAGQFREVLPEWLAAMARAGRRAREEDLVALLEQGRNHRGLRAAIALVLGSRGRWLAAQNPDWSYVTGGQNTDCDWQTASREWRLEKLKRCRASDPMRARELVASTWNQETPADRALFLESFAAGLSTDDEPFLESALDDKHAGVRRAAAELLSRLAESGLCQRMIARIGPLVQFSEHRGKLQINVTLPDQYTKDMARDGVEKKVEGMGEKNAWLHQLLACVPPTNWCQATGRSAAELIAAAERSEWKPTLMSAWTAAARRHSDIDWIEAILTCNEWRNSPNTRILEQVFSCLPRARQEKLLVQLLWAAPGPLPNPAEFLQRIDPPWGLELSHAVIEFVKRETKSRAGQLNGLTWTILRLAAGRMPPSCAEEVTEKLQPRSESSPPILIQAVNESLELLQFRHEMLSEFMP